MKISIVFLFLLASITLQQPSNYKALLELWKNKVPKQLIIPVREYSTQGEKCNEQQCEYYYFLSEHPQTSEQHDKNLTVLLLSGLRGTDQLSQSVLLNAYGVLNAARIIYFPFANPSGQTKGTNFTFPGNIDVENDFPIGETTNCKQTSAYKILEHIYSKYTIDLSVYVHNGLPSFSYSWGKQYINGDYRTKDFGIYTDISEMVRFKSDQMRQLGNVPVGTLFDLKLGNTGNFVDWAYGASQILSKECNGQKNEPHTDMKTNGLAFSLGLGNPKPEESSDKYSHYIQRGINILEGLVSITNPRMKFSIVGKNMVVGLSGCKGGSMIGIKLLNEKGEEVFVKEEEVLVKGDIVYGPPPSTTIPLPKDVKLPKDIQYELKYTCDNGWINHGKTVFAKVRTFSEKGVFTMKDDIINPTATIEEAPVTPKPKETHDVASSDVWSTLKIVGVAFIAIFVSGWIVAGVRLALKIQKKQRIKNFNQKFEIIEFVEDTESFSNHFSQKEHEAPELVSIKESQGSETDQIRLNSQ